MEGYGSNCRKTRFPTLGLHNTAGAEALIGQRRKRTLPLQPTSRLEKGPKMQYFALNNGQQQQFGSHFQRTQAAPHFTHDGQGNPQAATANTVLQHRTANSGAQPSQSSHFNFHSGAYPARPSLNRQTSAGPHHVSSHQMGGVDPYSYSNILRMLIENSPSSSSNVQSGNPGFQTSYGYNVARQQDLHQNSATQSQPMRMATNAVYSQEDMSTYWKQTPVSLDTQSKTSQNVCSSPLMSASANSQTVHNRLYRQNSTQRGYSPSNPPTSSNMANSLPFRNPTTATTNLSPSAQVLYNTNMSQKTQQFPSQLCSSYSSGVHANNAHNPNSYNQNKASVFLTKSKEPPSNPEGAIRGNMNSAYLGQYTAHPDGPPPPYISLTYRGQQGVSNSRMTVPNQNTQPVTSAFPETYKLDFISARPLHSGQSLTETPESAMSRATHPANVPSQQNSAPDVFCSNPTGNGSGRSMPGNTSLPTNNTISNGLLNKLLSDTHPLEEATSTLNKTHLSKSKSCEMQEMQSAVKQSDSSVLLSPGHTGTRAVAVVQPLSLESYASVRTPSIATTSESSSHPEKIYILANPVGVHAREESNLCSEYASQEGSNKSRAASDDTVALLTSVPQNSALKSVVDTIIAKTIEKFVISEAQVSPKDSSKLETAPTAHTFDLSSLPTTAWTNANLTNLIKECEKTQINLKPPTETPVGEQLIHMFWNSSVRQLIEVIKAGGHQNLFVNVHQHLKTHGKSDSVILWQVKQGCMEQLKNCHVLKDGEVYSEAPYKSSWLNVNGQLNDIDNESECHVDQVKTVNHSPPPTLRDVPIEVVPGTQLEPVNLCVEKQACTAEPPSTQASSRNEKALKPAYPGKGTQASTIEEPSAQTATPEEMEFEPACPAKETQASTTVAPSAQTAPPNETDSVDSSDECYSFKIEVLSPEEAKHVFGQIQSSQAKNVASKSVEVNRDATLSKSESVKMEQICCVTKWMQTILGADAPNVTKCKCKEEQSPKKITDRVLKVNPTMERSAPKKAKENVKRIMTSSRPEGPNKLLEIIDLTDNDIIPHLSSNQQPKNIPHISNNTQSNVVVIYESADEDLSTTETEIPRVLPYLGLKMSESGDECVQEENKSAETVQMSSSVSSEKEPEKFYGPDDDSSLKTSSNGESAHLSESPMESKADLKTTFSRSVKHKRKWKTLSSHDNLFPPHNNSKKCKRKVARDSERHLEVPSEHTKVSSEVIPAHPLPPNARTVELVLFGSTQGEKRVLKDTRKRHVSSSEGMSNEAQKPPDVLSVNLDSSGKEPSEAVSRGEHSAKRWIYENWKKSFQPTNNSCKIKLKTVQCPSASASGPSFKKGKLPVSPRRRASHGNVKLSKSLYKKKRSLSCELKFGEKTKEEIRTLKKPERRNTVGESTNGMHENNVLKFSVLPNTFTFKDGSSGRKETNKPLSDEPDVDEEKDQSPNKAAKKAKGSWYPNEKKCSQPAACSPPETPSLFHRFQKKYIEKTQTSM
ncbi:uncharacterized protein si:ch211-106e7.2 [Mugil cephalus]|uniref:uncharacterized protein si:ch211-106e7.2 n=1 Tax=Mugil cephalus TaxID=48193 RepID=UPI001FB7A594|nr:uncharacterized protein si:ch211-106e7.2 [Mugil cephalus]